MFKSHTFAFMCHSGLHCIKILCEVLQEYGRSGCHDLVLEFGDCVVYQISSGQYEIRENVTFRISLMISERQASNT
jgi:hypothetical protein